MVNSGVSRQTIDMWLEGQLENQGLQARQGMALQLWLVFVYVRSEAQKPVPTTL